jgi:hypothetical protein
LLGAYTTFCGVRVRGAASADRSPGIDPPRRIYDLRHAFATLALRAGISTFDLSRYMGASLTMIDRHYGHLARDGREHAIQVAGLAQHSRREAVDAGGRWVDIDKRIYRQRRQQQPHLSRQKAKAL